MIFLLNKERVLLEVTELARLRLAGWLAIDPAQVKARFELGKNNTPKPVFDINTEGCALGSRQVEESTKAIYGLMKEQLVDRLGDLNSRWCGGD